MNTNTPYVLAAAVIGAVLGFLAVSTLYPQQAHGDVATSTPPTIQLVVDPLTHRQKVWLYALEWCESRGNTTAVNKKDRDGTPSYGSFQFKPGTFYDFAQQYHIATTKAGYMDSDVQRAIVTQMIIHGVKWSWQFPDCTRKLGTPPKTPKLSTTTKA